MITVIDLLSRFPWLGGLTEEYLQAVLNDSMNTYSPDLFRYRDIVLLKCADTIQREQAGVIGDVLLSNGQFLSSGSTAYFSTQLNELLRQEGSGILWIS